MFIIKAVYNNNFEINAQQQTVKKFFTDVRNFVELMDNIESIQTDFRGVTRWTIRADIPFFGSFRQSFPVQLVDDELDRIEWLPATGESKNLLRYAADFSEKSEETTIIRLEQIVELRRHSATELHLLAPLAGDQLISQEMSKRIGQMIDSFAAKAKSKLEK